MKISHIKISNILGLDELELSPGGFTQIQGANGTGKTSVLEALKAVLQSGHDATLLRNGATKGEVVLVLDDGTELSKTVTAATSTTAVRRDGKKIPRPAEAIRALTDALSVNPVDFLLAPKKERARVLLESMPIEADTEHLSALSGIPVKAQPGMHALHVIGLVHQQVYDTRTGTNRAVREKQATINQLREAVPPAPEGVNGDEGELQAQLDAALQARDKQLGRIEAQWTKMKDEAAAAVTAAKEEAQRKIDEIRSKLEEQIAELNSNLDATKLRADAAREAARTTYTEAAEPVRQQLVIIRNDREASGRRQQTLDTIATLTTELETLTAEAESQTAALQAIEDYKIELLQALPIPGLEVRDGEIYQGDVLFDRLNTAQQVQVAVELAKLRAADLGVICVDRIEALDSATLDAFKASALESGLQMFVTRVADTGFSIETTD